jgi:uncharacterized protein with HEPN domain
MSRDDARDRVVEIMAALGKGREFVGSMSLADFTGDDKTMYAVIRALEIATGKGDSHQIWASLMANDAWPG